MVNPVRVWEWKLPLCLPCSLLREVRACCMPEVSSSMQSNQNSAPPNARCLQKHKTRLFIDLTLAPYPCTRQHPRFQCYQYHILAT